MKLNTKVIRLNTNTNQSTTSAEWTIIEAIKSFTYLVAIITTSRGTSKDIWRRLCPTRITYNKLSPVWNNSKISKRTKFRLFNFNVLSDLLCGSETWKRTKNDEHLMNTFLHKSIRRIFKIYWSQKVTNEKVKRNPGMESINTQSKRRWNWLGHVLE